MWNRVFGLGTDTRESQVREPPAPTAVQVQRAFRTLVQQAAGEELSYADFLDTVLGEDVQAKTAKNITMRTNLARFPVIKGLDAFDFADQSPVDKKQSTRLGNCHFIEHGENLVILGPPGPAS